MSTSIFIFPFVEDVVSTSFLAILPKVLRNVSFNVVVDYKFVHANNCEFGRAKFLTPSSEEVEIQMAPSKISDAEWQKHEPTIRRLYLDSDWTLDMVIREMSSSHGFLATQVSHHVYDFLAYKSLQKVTVHDKVQGLEFKEEFKF